MYATACGSRKSETQRIYIHVRVGWFHSALDCRAFATYTAEKKQCPSMREREGIAALVHSGGWVFFEFSILFLRRRRVIFFDKERERERALVSVGKLCAGVIYPLQRLVDYNVSSISLGRLQIDTMVAYLSLTCFSLCRIDIQATTTIIWSLRRNIFILRNGGTDATISLLVHDILPICDEDSKLFSHINVFFSFVHIIPTVANTNSRT
mmetsp:Transcript_29136/g.55259  ORF Transcript_29136/g.55259 Transcript_29136/m.55259 type:complete len:209 (-) Transcript_29136:1779-2405(-)